MGEKKMAAWTEDGPAPLPSTALAVARAKRELAKRLGQHPAEMPTYRVAEQLALDALTLAGERLAELGAKDLMTVARQACDVADYFRRSDRVSTDVAKADAIVHAITQAVKHKTECEA